VKDGQTDRQTDRNGIAITTVCIAICEQWGRAVKSGADNDAGWREQLSECTGQCRKKLTHGN